MTEEGRDALAFEAFGSLGNERATVWGPVLQEGQLILQRQDDTGEVTSEVISLSMAVEVLGGFDAIDWDAMDAAEAAIKAEQIGDD
jgi:hypothetical protein